MFWVYSAQYSAVQYTEGHVQEDPGVHVQPGGHRHAAGGEPGLVLLRQPHAARLLTLGGGRL